MALFKQATYQKRSLAISKKEEQMKGKIAGDFNRSTNNLNVNKNNWSVTSIISFNQEYRNGNNNSYDSYISNKENNSNNSNNSNHNNKKKQQE